jgi:uncharacterized protein
VNVFSSGIVRVRVIDLIVYPTLLRVVLLSLVMFASMQSHAVVVANLYNVEIPVADQSTKTRNDAFDDGLNEVLIRASGNHAVLDQVRVSSASTYVQQFLYKETGVAAGDEAANHGVDEHAARYLLQVRFNPAKIVELLRANAQPVWSEHRNEVVIWLAVRDGANRYILRRNDKSALKSSIESAAARRALPIVWPTYDKQDQQQLKFADVWAAFAGPVKTASTRYSDGPIVIGRLGWNGRQWSGEWTVYVEQSSRSWVFANADYDALVSQAMELVSDEIGSHYAVLDARAGSTSPDLIVEVEQVGSVGAFRKLSRYLGRLTAVKDVRVVSMDAGGHVVFEVSLRSRPEDFEKLVAIDNTLQQVSVTDPIITSTIAQSGAASPGLMQPRLHYRYHP